MRWETRGNDFLSLIKDELGVYSYRGSCGGGVLPAMPDDETAIAYMERPWGKHGAGAVTVLREDRPSLQRRKVV